MDWPFDINSPAQEKSNASSPPTTGIGSSDSRPCERAAGRQHRIQEPDPGADKAALAKQLGAHHYVDSKAGDPAAALQALGGAQVILATASDSKSMSALVNGLAPRGRMIVVGAGSDPIEISPLQLLFGSRSVEGALTGSAIDNEDTLAFSVLADIRPMIETVPLENAADAFARMERNQARFRMVIVMEQ